MRIRSFFITAGLLAFMGVIVYQIVSTALKAIVYAFLSWNHLQQIGFIVGIVLIVALINYMFRQIKMINQRAEQRQREERIQKAKTKEYLSNVDPRQFEFIVADVFRSLGYDAEVTKGSNDGGKDIILRKGKETKLVEVKRYNKASIGRPYIQKLHSAIVDAEAIGGYFVTLSHFNSNARQYAKGKNIELVDGSDLIRMMEKVTGHPV